MSLLARNNNAPLFVCDLKSEWGNNRHPKNWGVNGDMYAYMVNQYPVPAVNQVYGQMAVWQDNPATIHRTPATLEASDAFSSRIPHKEQAPKIAYVWPIENVWVIVKERVKANSKAQLKRVIMAMWRKIDADKGFSRRLVQSIPSRLEAFTAVRGWQVRQEEDYQQRVGININ